MLRWPSPTASAAYWVYCLVKNQTTWLYFSGVEKEIYTSNCNILFKGSINFMFDWDLRNLCRGGLHLRRVRYIGCIDWSRNCTLCSEGTPIICQTPTCLTEPLSDLWKIYEYSLMWSNDINIGCIVLIFYILVILSIVWPWEMLICLSWLKERFIIARVTPLDIYLNQKSGFTPTYLLIRKDILTIVFLANSEHLILID